MAVPKTGIVFSDNTNSGSVTDTLNLSNGQILALNSDWSSGAITLARFNTNGSLDTSFGVNGQNTVLNNNSDVYASASAIGLQSDGKILVTGGTMGVSGGHLILARFNANGSLDTSFGNQGMVVTDIGQSGGFDIVQQQDGKIIIPFALSYSNSDWGLVRFNSNGSIDTSFGINGIVDTGFWSNSVSIQSNGMIVVGGESTISQGLFTVARYTTNGVIDTSFGTQGKTVVDFGGTSNGADHIYIQSDGKIIAAGNTQTQSVSEFAIARLNSNGSLDSSFGLSGKVITDFNGDGAVGDIAVDSAGRIIALGGSNNDSGGDFYLARYSASGALDYSFGNQGKVITDFGYVGESPTSITIQSNGKILVSGSAWDAGSTIEIARYNSDGSLDSSFGAIRPELVSSNPIDGSTNVSTTNNLTFTFNGSIQRGAGFIYLFKDSRYQSPIEIFDVATSDRLSISGTTLTINPTNDLINGQKYVVEFQASTIKDFSGNNFGGVTTFDFTTLQSSTGSSGNDLLYGSVGDDTISGGDGSDTLIGGSGNDSLYGGNGTDTAQYTGSISNFKINPVYGGKGGLTGYQVVDTSGYEGTDSLDTAMEYISFSAGQTLVKLISGGTGTSGNDFITGTSSADSISGSDGNDTLDGGAGVDTLTGGGGDDTYIEDLTATGALQDTIIESVLTTNSDTVQLRGTSTNVIAVTLTLATYLENLDASNTGTSLLNLTGNTANNLLIGNTAANILNGGIGIDTLDGGYGDDTLIGGSGNDSLYGGNGTDTAQYSGSYSDFTITAIYGSKNTLTGYQVKDNLGSEGTDILDIAIEYLSFNSGSTRYSLSNGVVTLLTGTSGNDSLQGGVGDDTIQGGVGDDTIQGGVGDDTISGGDGNDTLIGGSGNDSLYGGNGTDTAQYTGLISNFKINPVYGGKGSLTGYQVVDTSGYEGTDSLDTAMEYISFSAGQTLVKLISGGTGTSGNDFITGTSSADSISGSDGNDTLDGGAGVDTLTGGGGDDTYIEDLTATGALQDTIIESVLTTNSDTVQLRGTSTNVIAVTLTLATYLENLDASNTGTSLLNLTGNSANNLLIGNAAANILNGGIGIDTLLGMAGNDTYVVDVAGDLVCETTTTASGIDAGGTDLVQVAIASAGGTYKLGTNIENGTLTNAVAYNLTGNELNNTLIGNVAANTLMGGTGLDTLTGGEGIDTFLIDGTDAITDLGNGGSDVLSVASGATVNANIKVAWTATVKTYNNGTANITTNGLAVNLAAVTTGSNGYKLTNTGVATTLTGSSLADTLTGGFGNDTISSGNGDDLIIGSLGSDKLDGGAGNDTLDLTTLAYDLTNRGGNSYTVTGTAANLTITDNVQHITTTVQNVENVVIGGKTISMGRFLAPNSVDITGKGLFYNELDKVSSIDEFLNTAPTYDHNYIDLLAYSEKVNLSRVSGEGWTTLLSYNPDAASNSLTFTSDKGSKLVYSDTQSNSSNSTGTSYNSSVSIALTGPTVTSGPAVEYKADKFTGNSSTKRTSTINAQQVTTRETWDDSKSLSFVDSKGTSNVADDITFSSSKTSKGNWVDSYVGGNYKGTTETDASTGTVSYKGNGLTLDVSLAIARNDASVWNASTNSSTTTKDLKIRTISKYAFADTRSTASTPMSLSFTGVITKDGVLNTAKYDFKTIALTTNDYSLTSATWSQTFTLDENGDDPLSHVNLGWKAELQSIEGAADSLKQIVIPLLLDADNTVTLKNQGVSFQAGAGKDSVTGGTGNDSIDGGSGNDTINGGSGNDTINGGSGNDTINGGTGDDLLIGSFGSDKIDGGAGNDILDLTNLGYDLYERGTSTYTVTGTATSFTITDNTTANKGAVTTVTNVEKVRIGGEDVSIAKFLAPNSVFITGLDGLMTEMDSRNAPSVAGLIASTHSAASGFVDIGRFAIEDWSAVELAFNPDAASNTLTFTSASKSSITLKTTNAADTKGSNYTSSVSFKSGDTNVKFDGSYGLKTTYTKVSDPSAASTVVNKAFTYSDTQGTTVTSDDVAASYTLAETETYQTNGSGYSYTSSGTVKQSYSGNGYSLNFDGSYSSNYATNSNGVIIVDNKTTTLKSYVFTDSANSVSLKGSGSRTIDNVTHREKVALNTAEWSDLYYKITATNVTFLQSTFTSPGNPVERLMNFGVGVDDDITAVYSGLIGLDPYHFLGAIINSDNVVTLKSNGSVGIQVGNTTRVYASVFDAGSGNDLVTGTVGSDHIIGGSGNDSILGGLGNDWISGGAEADKLSGGLGSDTFVFNLGDTGQTSNGIDQILDFAKGKVGSGDLIQLQTNRLVIGGSANIASSDYASVNQLNGVATFATGSGKTLTDALHDIASRFTTQTDQAGEFAFFKVANAGNYYLFVSDGQSGVTGNDLVVQLVGITSINTINIAETSYYIEGGLRVLS